MSSGADELRRVIRPAMFIESERLSSVLGARVIVATETFQRTGSFKFRAAYHVTRSVPNGHLITASSGNFGQALAYACRILKKRCTVVMPDSSARVKVEAVREFGGAVDLIDVRVISRAARVAELAAADPEAYVASAYDDPLVIEGNATLGEEIAAARFPIKNVVAAVGGGGLASGLITGLRRAGHAAAVIGVEPEVANDAARSLRAGELLKNKSEPDTIADGVRTLSVGTHNWPILKTGIERIVEVSEASIAEAVRTLFVLANLKVEPTGALAIAAVQTAPELFRGRCVCAVVTGGNGDPDLYARMLMGGKL